jgi:hypothetical protein
MRLLLTCCLVITLTIQANAATNEKYKYPDHGYLTGDTDKDFIEYFCVLGEDRKLRCSFTQVSMSHEKVKFDQREMNAALEGFRDHKISDCAEAATNKDNFDKGISPLDDGQKDDIAALEAAHLKACSNPTDENILGYFEFSNKLATAKCRIGINTFEQIFELSTGEFWQTTTSPDGLCGAIIIARFEYVDLFFWNYITRTIYTTKYPGTNNPVRAICNNPDEKEYRYSPKSSVFKNCRYMEW